MERLLRFLNRWIIWIALSLIIIPAVVYGFHFGPNLSNSKGDFGTFGDFMNPFLSLASILLLGYISLQTFITTRRYNNIQLRPHLFLQELPIDIPRHTLAWQMHLVSDAPAVNVFIRVNLGDPGFSKWVLCPPFSKNSTTLILTWIRQALAIEVMYSDITNQNLYGIRVQGRIHHVFDVDAISFAREVNRNRVNSDFHIGLDLVYRNIFTNLANITPYNEFIEENLLDAI